MDIDDVVASPRARNDEDNLSDTERTEIDDFAIISSDAFQDNVEEVAESAEEEETPKDTKTYSKKSKKDVGSTSKKKKQPKAPKTEEELFAYDEDDFKVKEKKDKKKRRLEDEDQDDATWGEKKKSKKDKEKSKHSAESDEERRRRRQKRKDKKAAREAAGEGADAEEHESESEPENTTISLVSTFLTPLKTSRPLDDLFPAPTGERRPRFGESILVNRSIEVQHAPQFVEYVAPPKPARPEPASTAPGPENSRAQSPEPVQTTVHTSNYPKGAGFGINLQSIPPIQTAYNAFNSLPNASMNDAQYDNAYGSMANMLLFPGNAQGKKSHGSSLDQERERQKALEAQIRKDKEKDAKREKEKKKKRHREKEKKDKERKEKAEKEKAQKAKEKQKQKEKQKRKNKVPLDPNDPNYARKKQEFKMKISATISKKLSAYFKDGRIASKDDFKHLARKFTHQIMERDKDRFSFTERSGPKIHKVIDAYFERHTIYSRTAKDGEKPGDATKSGGDGNGTDNGNTSFGGDGDKDASPSKSPSNNDGKSNSSPENGTTNYDSDNDGNSLNSSTRLGDDAPTQLDTQSHPDSFPPNGVPKDEALDGAPPPEKVLTEDELFVQSLLL